MWWDVSFEDAIVYAAGGAFVVAYLVTNQVWLRLIQMVGSGLYIWYYVVAADDPLWAAAAMSGTMVVANLIGLSLLFLRRSRIMLPRGSRDVFDMIPTLTPGDFRLLFKKAERLHLPPGHVLCTLRERPDHVHFVIHGEPIAEKGGHRFRMTGGIFVGEVAYLMRQPSSATVSLPDGAEVLRWPVATLEKAARRSPRFKLAFEAVIAHDMAAKVALAVAPDTFQVAATPV